MTVSSSLPLSREDLYHQPAPPLSEEGSYLQLVLPFRGESISSTCSSFPKRVHIFDLFFLFKENLYHHHYSSLWGKFVSSSLFLLARKFCSNYTKLVTEAWSTHQQLAHQYSHTGVLYLPSVPYPLCKISDFYVLWFIMEHRIICHLYTTLVVT